MRCGICSPNTAHLRVFSSLCLITCSRANYVAFLPLLSVEKVEKDNDKKKKVRSDTEEWGRWRSSVHLSTKHCSCCWMSEMWQVDKDLAAVLVRSFWVTSSPVLTTLTSLNILEISKTNPPLGAGCSLQSPLWILLCFQINPIDSNRFYAFYALIVIQ